MLNKEFLCSITHDKQIETSIKALHIDLMIGGIHATFLNHLTLNSVYFIGSSTLEIAF